MKTKTIEEITDGKENGYKLYMGPNHYKKVEIVDPKTETRVNFTLDSSVVIKLQKTKTKTGKLKAGTKELMKEYNFKVVIYRESALIAILFKKKDEAGVFMYQLFFSDVFKFVFDTERQLIYTIS